MVKYSWLPKLAAVGLGCVVVGCGGSARQGQVRTTPPPPPPPVTAEVKPVQAPAPPPVDPIQALIDDSQRLYEQGKRELDLGHLEQARAAFNRAIDVLLSAPGGARTEPRLRAQFDRLVDRISALEVAALATGDGFAEKPTEPASLDQLLAMSDTLTDAVRHARRRGDRADGSGRDRARHSDPAEREACSPTSSCSRDGCARSSRKASIAAASTCR